MGSQESLDAGGDLPPGLRPWSPPSSWRGPFPESSAPDPAAAWRTFLAGPPPDLLAVAHPELFAGRELERPLEVAVFALLSSGLLRAYRTRFAVPTPALRLVPAPGLPPPPEPQTQAWAAEVVMHLACAARPGQFGNRLHGLVGLSQRVARDGGVLVRVGGKGWRRVLPAWYEPAPHIVAETLGPAHDLSQRWLAFTQERDWYKALIGSTGKPAPAT